MDFLLQSRERNVLSHFLWRGCHRKSVVIAFVSCEVGVLKWWGIGRLMR